MEVLIAIMMMIVPIISLAALFLALRSFTKVKAIRELVLEFIKDDRTESKAQKAMREFRMNEL